MERYLAFDIGGTEIKWAAVRADGSLGERCSRVCDFRSAVDLVDSLAEIASSYREEPGGIVGVGVSVPGGVRDGLGDGVVVRGGSLPFLDGCSLGSMLRERLNVPVAVENDGACCALGEYRGGALNGVKFGMVLAIGTGVGGAIVCDGRVLRGAHGFAGEVSFLQNNIEKPFARERAWGVTGGWRQLRAHVCREMDISEDDSIDGRALFEWIGRGDGAAVRGLNRYAREFARWVVNIQALIDPERIVIAGGISARPELVEAIQVGVNEVMAERSFPFDKVPRPRVIAAQLGNAANLLGAVHPLL